MSAAETAAEHGGNVYDKYGTRNPVARRLMAGFTSDLDALVDRTEVREGHEVGWLSAARGRLEADGPITAGEMAVFERSRAAIRLRGGTETGARFVLGTAVPHPYDLVLGYYSVHTSLAALKAGEARIAELRPR